MVLHHEPIISAISDCLDSNVTVCVPDTLWAQERNQRKQLQGSADALAGVGAAATQQPEVDELDAAGISGIAQGGCTSAPRIVHYGTCT